MRAAVLSLLLSLAVVASAPADEAACESCRHEDEVQAGGYTPPDVPQVARPDLPDPRGREVSLPVGGLPSVRVRPGAGLYVGAAGAGNNVFVKPGRDKVSVGMKHDF